MKIFWKMVKTAMWLFALLFAFDALLVFGVGLSQPVIPKTDAGIILGAAIYTPALYNRSLKGLELYDQNKVGVLVLSGGRISDKDMSEAQYMEKVITRNSKAHEPALLILEQESHSTYDNIVNSKKKIPEAKSVIIISDRFHVARGVVMAKAAGFEKVYWASPDPSYYSFRELSQYYLRELVAMFAYIPKFLAVIL